MGLQLVLGGSGSGKTTYLCKELIEKSKKDRGNYLFIVPEQYTMEMQKNIVNASEEKGTMNIDILSFDRFAKRIFDEAGKSRFSILDDTGKCLLIRKIIEENKDRLVVFGNKAGMNGFIEEVKSIISEFYQYGIDEKRIEKMIEMSKDKQLLQAKLKDIKIIFEEIKKSISDEVIINEELLQRVCELIPESKLMENCHIVFDEYTGFTPVQYKVIKYLLEYASEVSVALTIRDYEKIDMDKVNPDTNIFGIVIKTIKKLEELAKDSNVEIRDYVVLKNNRFNDKKSDLDYLEKNIFKFGTKGFEGNADNISVHICNNVFNETEYVAYTICKLVREEGYRYKDIAVVTADVESYYRGLTESFVRHGIPGFIDHKRSIISNPMVESIRAALNIIYDNFSYESVFRYLKAGMTNISDEEIDIFENYVITHGIKGRRKYETKIEDEGIEELRERFVEEIDELYKIYKNGRKVNVREGLEAIFEFTLKLNMADKLEEYRNYFIENNELSRAKEYQQTNEKVIELLDKIVNLIGEERLTLKELAAILDSGFENIKVGVIPPTLDRVVVGDIERTRLNNVKVLFLIGANDGLIPKSESGAGIFTRMERNYLYENDVVLSPTVKENAFIQKYYLYLLLTKMSDKLYLSFKRINADGKSASQSYIIQSICNMYSQVNKYNEDIDEKKEIIETITNFDSAKSYVAGKIYDYINGKLLDYDEKLFREIYSFCKNNNIEIEKFIDAATYEINTSSISKAVASALYGKNITNSVSRLENFASCAYRHFLNYGLNIVPRKEYEVKPYEVGNIYHKAIELFFKKIASRKIDWEKLDDELRDKIITESILEATEKEGSDVFEDTARNSYVLERIGRMTKKTAWILQQQVIRGKFVPKDFEIRFNSESGLDELKYVYEDGTQMGIKGVIDRVDYFNSGDDIYVKIIDYKSGNKKLELNDVYNGISLQLVLYMEAALELTRRNNQGKNVIPAGLLYYNIDDPVIDEKDIKEKIISENDEEIKEIIEEKTLIKTRPVGFFSNNEYVIGAFDRNIDSYIKNGGESSVINVKYGKTKMSTNDKALSEEQMNTLIKFVHGKVGELGEKILKGEISLNPYISQSTNGNINEKTSPCAYCDFKGICGFDRKIKGCDYRRFSKMKPEAIWQTMREEKKDNGMDK